MIGRITRDKIKDRLRGKPHLIPVFSSVYSIPERLYEYDSSMFVVWNVTERRYEIHCLDHVGDTFGMPVPYYELDSRIVERVKRSDLRLHGRDIFRQIDENNERLERSRERQRRNDINAAAREMAPAFRKLAWEGV